MRPLDIGRRRELFVDTHLIDNLTGHIHQYLHEPADKGLVIDHDAPWEGTTCGYNSTVKVCRRGLREARKESCLDLGIRFALQGARAARRSGDPESAMAWLSEARQSLDQTSEYPDLAVDVGWTLSAVLLDLRQTQNANL